MSLATEPQLASVHGRIADVYADRDERRGAWLKLLLTKGGTCHACGASVNDGMMEKHPGVCGVCFLKRKVRPDPELLAELAALSAAPESLAPALKTFTPDPPASVPAEPKPEETAMACPECKSPSRHRTGCSKNPEKKPTPAPAKRVPLAPTRQDVAPTKWAKALSAMEGPELVNLRDAVTAELHRRRDAAEKVLQELKSALGEAA
jgi:hypothetical protein